MINIMITLNIHNMRVMWLCSAEVVILMPQNHLSNLGGKFGCYFQGNTLLNKFVQVDSYFTSKSTRRMVRAIDSVCAFDMLVMLWWLSELLLSTGLSPHPPIWTNSPPCLYISASVLKCTVLVIAVENHKLNQLELFQRHFLAFVEAQLANWYKLGWFGSFELLRSHLSDLLQWSKVVFGCQFWKNHF